MKRLMTTLVLLAGPTSIAFAHTLTLDEGFRALYHQLLGMHHLPITVLLIVIGIVLLRLHHKRSRSDGS
jgi:hypothetical protein